MSEFPKQYDHTKEHHIYTQREQEGCFAPKAASKGKKTDTSKKFVMPMPPPNVTGILHLGHALTFAIEDTMVRYHRMIGDETLWVPGTDHAGIATQVVVEKKLKKEKNQSRYDIGREKFLDEVWNRSKSCRHTIVSQIKSLGASCDRSREQFTMSEQLSRAVRKAFSDLFAKGLVYQGERITNRSIGCQTVLSDIEIDYVENEGKLYYVNYFIEGKADFITIATTRPETMFADVAVAVNPYDKRFKKFVGKNVLIPIINKAIPVIADELVDMQFGSGALKITPTHDPLDYEIAKKHSLPLNVFAFDKYGKFTEHAGAEFVGKDINEFFENIVEHLQEIGNLVKVEPHKNTIPICQRSGTRVQPMLSKQRFIDVEPLAKKAWARVQNGEVKVVPQRYADVLEQWLTNIRPWCISRQLWRGHRIPVWFDQDEGVHVFDEDTRIQAYKENKEEGGKKKEKNEKSAKKKEEKLVKQGVLSLMIFNLIADARLANPFNIEQIVDLLFSQGFVGNGGNIGQSYLQMYKQKFSDDKQLLEQVKSLEEIFGGSEKKAVERTSQFVDLLDSTFGLVQKGDLYELDLTLLVPGATSLRQDEDVFDTRFSSGLWPFSIHGRPENTQDLGRYYPASVLETGGDIIFFWVARMLMLAESQTDQKPFDTIYLHGMVRDEKGQKMSKSTGNGIDPLQMIEKYGADALRLSLITGCTPGNDVNFSEKKADYYRRFVTKLWNASRFVMMNILGEQGKKIEFDLDAIQEDLQKNSKKFNDFDSRIVQQTNELIEQSEDVFSKYHIGEYAQSIVQTLRHSYCDRYIEIAKTQKSDYTDKILLYVLGTLLKLLHPYAPFVTEKLRQLVGFDGMLCASVWPQAMSLGEKNYKINLLMNVITQLRTMRSASEIKPHEQLEVYLQSNFDLMRFFQGHEQLIKQLLNAKSVQCITEGEQFPQDAQVQVLVNVTIGMKGIKVMDKRQRLMQMEQELQEEMIFLQDLRNLMANSGFLSSAPAALVEQKKAKMDSVKQKIQQLEVEIGKLKIEMK